MTTMRKIESIHGTGHLWRNENSLGEIELSLNIWQEFFDAETPGLRSGEGTLYFKSEVSATDMMLEPDNLRLELSDGRSAIVVPQGLSGQRVTFVISGPLE